MKRCVVPFIDHINSGASLEEEFCDFILTIFRRPVQRTEAMIVTENMNIRRFMQSYKKCTSFENCRQTSFVREVCNRGHIHILSLVIPFPFTTEETG